MSSDGPRAQREETSNEGAKGEQWRPGERSGFSIAGVAACMWVGGGRDLHMGRGVVQDPSRAWSN